MVRTPSAGLEERKAFCFVQALLTSAVCFCQQLEAPVMAKGNVELWLGDLLNQAMNSLHAVIRDAYLAINDGGFNLMNFLGQFPSQVRSLPSFFQGIPPKYWKQPVQVYLHCF